MILKFNQIYPPHKGEMHLRENTVHCFYYCHLIEKENMVKVGRRKRTRRTRNKRRKGKDRGERKGETVGDELRTTSTSASTLPGCHPVHTHVGPALSPAGPGPGAAGSFFPSVGRRKVFLSLHTRDHRQKEVSVSVDLASLP